MKPHQAWTSSGRILVYEFPVPMPELLAILRAAPPGSELDSQEAKLLGVALVIRWDNPPPVVHVPVSQPPLEGDLLVATSGKKGVPPPSFYGSPEYEYYRNVMVGITEKEEGLTEDELKVIVYLSSRYQRVAELLAGRSNYDKADRAFAHAPERHLNTDRWHTLRAQLIEREQVLAIRDGQVFFGPKFSNPTSTAAVLIECLVEALAVMREFEDRCAL